MNKEFVITLTTTERKKMETKCRETKELLVSIADAIEDQEERANFWAKIRNFNPVIEVFTD